MCIRDRIMTSARPRMEKANVTICEHGRELLGRLVDPDPASRFNVQKALEHDFFKCCCEVRPWSLPVKPKAEETPKLTRRGTFSGQEFKCKLPTAMPKSRRDSNLLLAIRRASVDLQNSVTSWSTKSETVLPEPELCSQVPKFKTHEVLEQPRSEAKKDFRRQRINLIKKIREEAQS
eukprot:TRINITY_DN27887_c0_g1_i1.p1 TRINITY_DN27887_c0_g1~~TRINITY_DN27887_c0_g1_i1.p1  ORF type:complete len:177 (+),score=18.69 TRINITY_DN27887_c0_g1_i1:60-590(+)